MDYLKQFVIPFVGLSDGPHQYDYDIDDKFFASYEYTDISRANVRVDITLDKRDRMMVLEFRMLGTLGVACSRCGELFDMPVDTTETLYIKLGHEYKEDYDEVVTIPDTESHLNTAPWIFDFLCLAVPYRVVHPDKEDGTSGCDPEVIARLEEQSGNPDVDPRWDKLKDLNLE